jgi:hypothetical protein
MTIEDEKPMQARPDVFLPSQVAPMPIDHVGICRCGARVALFTYMSNGNSCTPCSSPSTRWHD